ncbi:hypothetical protein QIS74_10063 [Colletotrichum tabaci]|uniref:DUF3669 domain-containing protein n=1 Tax=Colletotrichum tabaci TaxID=1209068 RepID=A0AAV9T318_9PEZI
MDFGKDLGPTEVLLRYLSRNTLLTPTTTATIQQKQKTERQDFHLEHIGEGFCAIMYDFASTGQVIKQAKGWNKHPELWTDYTAHQRIYAAGLGMGVQVCIPQPAYFIAPENVVTWYSRHRDAGELPDDPTLLKNMKALLVSERIPALPQTVRDALVDVFCPEDQKAAARASPENRNCLLRLYLGRRRAYSGIGSELSVHNFDFSLRSAEFRLRNFEFTLDKMEDLGVDPMQFVAPMAEALAVMHWRVRCDAFDVEFVLGSSPKLRVRCASAGGDDEASGEMRTTWNREPGDDNNTNPECLQRAVQVWLLDFNQVGGITMDEEGVDKAVRGFWDNDPYYPRPAHHEANTTEVRLWEMFKEIYLTTSFGITADTSLPRSFITKVEEEATARSASVSILQGPPKGPTSAARVGGNTGKKTQRHYPGVN